MLLVAIPSKRIPIVPSIRWNLVIRPPGGVVVSAVIVPLLAVASPILRDDGAPIQM